MRQTPSTARVSSHASQRFTQLGPQVSWGMLELDLDSDAPNHIRGERINANTWTLCQFSRGASSSLRSLIYGMCHSLQRLVLFSLQIWRIGRTELGDFVQTVGRFVLKFMRRIQITIQP